MKVSGRLPDEMKLKEPIMKKLLTGLFIAFLALLHPLASAAETPSGKVLIVYYSQTDNTAYLARKLQEKTGADMFRLETVKAYPRDNPGRIDVPKAEWKTGNLPALKQMPANLSQYDLILVGTPVWFGTVSNPVKSFLKQADLGGKKVAVFFTYGGNPGNIQSDFKSLAKNAVVLEGFGKSRPQQDKMVDSELDRWLSEIRK